MGEIAVHEFVSLDGVFEDPSWTFDHGFVPAMGDTLGAITGASTAILLGRRTYEMFAPAWSHRIAMPLPPRAVTSLAASSIVPGPLSVVSSPATLRPVT